MAASVSPPTRIGIEAWTGRGLHVTGGKSTKAPWNSAWGPAHSARMAATYSSLRAPRCSHGTPSASNSSRSQPTPRPSSTRPPESWSSVASSFASTSGLRWGTMRMQVPSRMVGAAAAAKASQISGSGMGVSLVAGILPSGVYGYLEAMVDGRMTCSPPQSDSKPAASARRQIPRAAAPSMPMLLANANPNFISSPQSPARAVGKPRGMRDTTHPHPHLVRHPTRAFDCRYDRRRAHHGEGKETTRRSDDE